MTKSKRKKLNVKKDGKSGEVGKKGRMKVCSAISKDKKEVEQQEEKAYEIERDEMLEEGKAKGIVYGYPGKRPHHLSNSADHDTTSGTEVRPFPRIYSSRRPLLMDVSMKFNVDWFNERKLRRAAARQRSSDTPEFFNPQFKGVTSLSEYLQKYFEERPKEWKEDGEKHLFWEDLRCAEATLACYNNQKEVKYEVIETVGSYYIDTPDGIMYHCNFWARPTSASEHKCTDCSPKLFFAELIYEPLQYKIKSCHILDDTRPGSQVVYGDCLFCPKVIAHPGEDSNSFI